MCPQRRSLIESLGLGVTTLRELSWETAGFEQQVRDTFSSFGTRMTHFVGPASNPVKEFAREHPIQAILLGGFIAACAFPIIVFLSFALMTLSIGVIGFLCIEGTILSFGLLILGSCLLTISFVGLSIGTGILSVYITYKKARQFINTILNKFLPSNEKTAASNENTVTSNGSLVNGKVHTEDELSSTESDGIAEVSPSAH